MGFQFSKKGISSVIVIGLLLVITLIAVLNFQTWFGLFQSSIFVDIENKDPISNLNTKIETVVGDRLYIKTDTNLTINKIEVNGVDCEFSGTIFNMKPINLSLCLENISSMYSTIDVITDNGLLVSYVYIKNREPTVLEPDEINIEDIFISVWDTSLEGSASNQIELPLETTGLYDFLVISNGTFTQTGTNSIMITNYAERLLNFTEPGIYQLNISGEIIGFRFNDAGDKRKILEISQWGNLNLGNNGGYFKGVTNLDIIATDPLDLTGTTNLAEMFLMTSSNSFRVSGNINIWDTSNVTDMSQMFEGGHGGSVWNTFDGDISGWDTGNVINMNRMFRKNTRNLNITAWNTSNVLNMGGMFFRANNFNQNIGSWNTGNVVDMNNMFFRANNFNQNIGSWNTSRVTNMAYMFERAINFNQNIGSWNTGRVTNMAGVFQNANRFNQDISAWDVRNVTHMNILFGGASDFNQNLSAWCVPNIFEKPSNFDSGTGNWIPKEGRQPNWGCI